jgi:hypothetical protein
MAAGFPLVPSDLVAHSDGATPFITISIGFLRLTSI